MSEKELNELIFRVSMGLITQAEAYETLAPYVIGVELDEDE